VTVTALSDIHYLSFFTARLSGTARLPPERFEGAERLDFLDIDFAGAKSGCGGKPQELSTKSGRNRYPKYR
jgi:hypothetical protein